MALASGAARSESLYRAFAIVRLVPGFTRSGDLLNRFCTGKVLALRAGLRGQPSLTFSALISLHERRSRNMMARIEGRELSPTSNLIPTVKRSPKTSSREPFVPQTLPPGRTGGRRGGASMVSLPSAGYGVLHGEYERGRSELPKRRLSAGCRLRQGWARPRHA